MTMRKRVDIESALLRKGFVKRFDGDHRFFDFFQGERFFFFTKVSHGTKYKEIGDDLLSQMAKQCHLSKKQFLELIDCSMSQEDYETILRENEII